MEQLPKELDFIQMGKRIRAQRESLGFTREKLAEKMGVSSKFIADLENGAKGIILKKFYTLVQILDVSADYILAGKNPEQDQERLNRQEGILEQLKNCDNDQLECMEAITKYFVKSHKTDQG